MAPRPHNLSFDLRYWISTEDIEHLSSRKDALENCCCTWSCAVAEVCRLLTVNHWPNVGFYWLCWFCVTWLLLDFVCLSLYTIFCRSFDVSAARSQCHTVSHCERDANRLNVTQLGIGMEPCMAGDWPDAEQFNTCHSRRRWTVDLCLGRIHHHGVIGTARSVAAAARYGVLYVDPLPFHGFVIRVDRRLLGVRSWLGQQANLLGLPH